jgi:hypothetical protein
MKKVKFGCPKCAIDEDMRIEGKWILGEWVQDLAPRLQKKKGLAENVFWCERCDKTFLIIEMPDKKYGKKG